MLSSSGYAYAEGFLVRNLESWISAHVNTYQFFGGSTRIVAPDNLKTGVVKADWYSPVINRTYHEMAEYYRTAVIPTGVRKPREKALVERTVGMLSTWIIAALRNRQFFSLVELNQAVRQKLVEFNKKPFQRNRAAGKAPLPGNGHSSSRSPTSPSNCQHGRPQPSS